MGTKNCLFAKNLVINILPLLPLRVFSFAAPSEWQRRAGFTRDFARKERKDSRKARKAKFSTRIIGDPENYNSFFFGISKKRSFPQSFLISFQSSIINS